MAWISDDLFAGHGCQFQERRNRVKHTCSCTCNVRSAFEVDDEQEVTLTCGLSKTAGCAGSLKFTSRRVGVASSIDDTYIVHDTLAYCAQTSTKLTFVQHKSLY